MKIKLLIATSDRDYVEHLSSVLSENYADVFEVGVCSSTELLEDSVAMNRFDVALLEPRFVSFMNLNLVSLPLILWDGLQDDAHGCHELRKVRKYQKISSLAGNVLEEYAGISSSAGNFASMKAKITAVWSPAGGVGKTTVALAYAAHKASSNEQVVYLNLESFSSTSIYFSGKGKSISAVFENLDSNLPVLLKGIRQQDSGSGITYFGGPINYDDINVLTEEDVKTIINACATDVDELIIDLPSQCDKKVQQAFELANTVFLVSDQSSTSEAKLKQFINQHSVAQKIQEKSVLVNNKGAI